MGVVHRLWKSSQEPVVQAGGRSLRCFAFLPAALAAVLLFETVLGGRRFKTCVLTSGRFPLFRLTPEARRGPRVPGPQPGGLPPVLSARPTGDCRCALSPPAAP